MHCDTGAELPETYEVAFDRIPAGRDALGPIRPGALGCVTGGAYHSGGLNRCFGGRERGHEQSI